MILILRAGQEMLGMSTLRKPPGDKETWWWNDDVNAAIRANKEPTKKRETSQRGRQLGLQVRKQGGKERGSKLGGAAMDDIGHLRLSSMR